MNTESAFKVCSNCGHQWDTLNDFLADKNLKLTGYQAHFDDLTGGLILFVHAKDGCYTTLGIPVKDFVSLSNRPILNAHTRKPADCPQQCMREGCLAPCPIKCECSWVREIVNKIRNWPKTAA